MTTPHYPVLEGTAFPLGATQKDNGINFALFSQHATAVSLLLFFPLKKSPFLEITLDPKIHKTENVWHIFVRNLPPSLEYGYRIKGPSDSQHGHLYDPSWVLCDPYARSISSSHQWGKGIPTLKDKQTRGRIFPKDSFDWEGDAPPNIPMQDLIIYEMHVRGFTQDVSSKTKHAGSFLGMIEKIPYLKKLGVNALEFLPIFEFNEKECLVKNAKDGSYLPNYWGYSTVNFFSPMNRYAISSEEGAAIKELKTLIKTLHKNGIELILDVVYNHTAEGSKSGPTLCFRGIDNAVYYLLDEKGEYLNFSGTGNTFNCNHPTTMALILDSLRYWVSEMHVDGFRFDLASVLTRDPKGIPSSEPPLIKAICEDPVLSKVKLIAEAWDAAGLYQVGSFPSWGKWAEWNGKFRDATRRFIKGTDGESGAFAHALAGSEELYGKDRKPYHSVNFITAHDGFTLNDLVSYQNKHNEENGEENRDGANDNESWNCGEEGETKNPKIELLRKRQMRNFHLALMLSLGTPMLLMGDEYGHSRKGNNNTWSHDNTLNWFLWDHLERDPAFFRFYTLAIAFRKKHSLLRRTEFLKKSDVSWHGHLPLQPNWDPKNRFIAYTLIDPRHTNDLYIAFNADFQTAHIQLPEPLKGKRWMRIVDTSLPSPEDFLEKGKLLSSPKNVYDMLPYSAFVAKSL